MSEEKDEAPSTASLIARAQYLIAEAEKEKPFTKARWDALVAEVELVCLEADEPDDVRDVVAEQLAWLKPGGEFEDTEGD